MQEICKKLHEIWDFLWETGIISQFSEKSKNPAFKFPLLRIYFQVYKA